MTSPSTGFAGADPKPRPVPSTGFAGGPEPLPTFLIRSTAGHGHQAIRHALRFRPPRLHARAGVRLRSPGHAGALPYRSAVHGAGLAYQQPGDGEGSSALLKVRREAGEDRAGAALVVYSGRARIRKSGDVRSPVYSFPACKQCGILLPNPGAMGSNPVGRTIFQRLSPMGESRFTHRAKLFHALIRAAKSTITRSAST